VLRDWSTGKFDRYTTPPPPVTNTATAQSESFITTKLAEPDPCYNITQLYVNDEVILSSIQTRKKRRKEVGLVKFTYGSIDSRKVAVLDQCNGLKQNDNEESNVDEVDVEGMDIDDEVEVEDEENEDEDKDKEEALVKT
jgi:nuclear GTP-binding protein